MFSCTLCAKTLQSSGALSRHVLGHTKEKSHKCLICEATFGLKYSLKNHVKTVHDGVKKIMKRNTHCPLCSYKCCGKKMLQTHMLKHSSELPFSCDKPSCGFKTKCKLYLERHVSAVHSGDRPYQCPSDGCDYKAQKRATLKRHLQVHSNEKPFACKVPGCKYSCKTKVHLKSHTSRAHCDEKPFKCSICDFRAKFKQDITVHQRTHMKTKRFKCQAPNCDFSTNWKTSLVWHFDANHKKKDLRCTEPGCHYSCSSMFLLKRHNLRGHEKPLLKCPGGQCHFRTRFRQQLLKHISRFHEDIQSTAVVGPRKFDVDMDSVAGTMKKLQCCVPNCGYQTKFRQHYDHHRYTHKKEEKWQHVCPFCFSRFRKLQGLQSHIQRHLGEKPYSCSFCKYTTVRDSAELRSHGRKLHHIHVIPRAEGDALRKCCTCGKTCSGYCEFVLHSMKHLQPIVLLERLKLHIL